MPEQPKRQRKAASAFVPFDGQVRQRSGGWLILHCWCLLLLPCTRCRPLAACLLLLWCLPLLVECVAPADPVSFGNQITCSFLPPSSLGGGAAYNPGRR